MTISPLYAGITQETISIRGTEVLAPVFFPRVSMMAGVFLADLEVARSLMPTPQHKPVAVLPGRTVVAVQCFEYMESGVGAYNEISLSIATTVDGPRGFRARNGLRSLLSSTFHGFVVDLPVTTELALHGGLDYYNFPKHLAEIEYSETDDVRSCNLRDADSQKLILDAHVRKTPTTGLIARWLRGRTLSFCSYPVLEGEIVRAEVRLRLLDAAIRRDGRFNLSLQDHPKAEIYHRLRLSKPLLSVYAPRCEGLLFLTTPLA